MKKTKKILAMACAMALSAAIAVGGTLAYLTSTTEVVTNTFTVGKVAITLDEADVNEYGQKLNDKDGIWKEGDTLADRVMGNEYKLMPGHKYFKDPTVTVKAGSESSYIRMIVTISDIADVKAVLGNDFLPQNFVEGWNNDKWATTGQIIETNDTAVYEFWYHEPVSTDGATDDLALEPLFTHIKVPGTVDNDGLKALDEMEIQVIAQAIQADGFANAEAAWAAWE